MSNTAKKTFPRILVSTLLAVAAACAASSAQAQAVVPPQSESFPLTYGEWGARWWQYVYGIPADQNPLSDSTGSKCHVGQWGPVFFLVGTAGGEPVKRSCDVPAGMGLFFPIINASCAVPEDGNTAADISKACSDFIDLVDRKSLSLTIDGKSVENLNKFRASEFFSFTGAIPGVSATTGCGTPPCYEGFRAIAFTDGYWAMLRPLQPGPHKVRFQGTIPSFSFTVDVTYKLNVVR
jgi:hypothetical protein